MSNWWDFDTIEERNNWINNVVNSIKGYHELKINHAENAKYSPLGEIGYINNELSKLTSEGIKCGGMAADWVKSECEKYDNIEKEIIKCMDECHHDIYSDFRSFDAQLRHFLLLYFQWEKLTKLKEEAEKKEDLPAGADKIFLNQGFDIFAKFVQNSHTWEYDVSYAYRRMIKKELGLIYSHIAPGQFKTFINSQYADKDPEKYVQKIRTIMDIDSKSRKLRFDAIL